MTLPGFTAEASLHRTATSYRFAESHAESGIPVVPAFTLTPGLFAEKFLCKVADLISASPLCSSIRGDLVCCECNLPPQRCQLVQDQRSCNQFCSRGGGSIVPLATRCQRNRCV